MKKFDVPGVYAPDDQAAYTARVLRHEIVHAFFEERGLTGSSSDEALVEWLAVQIPKIVGTMKEAGIFSLKSAQKGAFRP